ncbi:GNAT family N-acetyltransferase [Cohnella lupini]|uniref:RimJ/RimL family protein N-acetyltransferase n=1 Tax=Cohnella lupini TaxID=1294267 RepID=A0A3D9IBZ5_9BACL|nr:GNAT family protein [Cohnella lupini]RED59175.1 RimJ/RimL family protein N-acetyltransferase [Cohnella lupini]
MLNDQTNLIGNKVQLRDIQLDDFLELYQLTYGEEKPEWKNWDAPYFPLKPISFEEFQEGMRERIEDTIEPRTRMIIQSNNEIIGIVSYYWEHKPSNWLEIGIVIYKPDYWNGGFGTESLRLWIQYLFIEFSLVRIGLTTWSGNVRMMKVAEKLGMKLEGQIRKCRLHDGIYYDSIRMGILREEWNEKKLGDNAISLRRMERD